MRVSNLETPAEFGHGSDGIAPETTAAEAGAGPVDLAIEYDDMLMKHADGWALRLRDAVGAWWGQLGCQWSQAGDAWRARGWLPPQARLRTGESASRPVWTTAGRPTSHTAPGRRGPTRRDPAGSDRSHGGVGSRRLEACVWVDNSPPALLEGWRDGGIGWAWPRMAAFNLPAGPRRPVAIRPPVNRATKHVPVLVDGGSRVSEALAVVGGRWYVISGTPPRGSWTRTPKKCLAVFEVFGPQRSPEVRNAGCQGGQPWRSSGVFVNHDPSVSASRLPPPACLLPTKSQLQTVEVPCDAEGRAMQRSPIMQNSCVAGQTRLPRRL